MFSQLFQHNPIIVFPLVGLGLFISVFGSIILRTFARAPEAYQATADLPLSRDGGDHV